jgi:hypothetical protein
LRLDKRQTGCFISATRMSGQSRERAVSARVGVNAIAVASITRRGAGVATPATAAALVCPGAAITAAAAAKGWKPLDIAIENTSNDD